MVSVVSRILTSASYCKETKAAPVPARSCDAAGGDEKDTGGLSKLTSQFLATLLSVLGVSLTVLLTPIRCHTSQIWYVPSAGAPSGTISVRSSPSTYSPSDAMVSSRCSSKTSKVKRSQREPASHGGRIRPECTSASIAGVLRCRR